jgi:hypothetical protein
MVAVAQLVEPQVVILVVGGSSPLGYPKSQSSGGGNPVASRLSREAPLAQWQSNGLLIRRFWVRLPGGAQQKAWSRAISGQRPILLTRYPTGPLMSRAYELRANVTAYDASYVAVAEALDCVLVTGDRRLARASGPRCRTVTVGQVPEFRGVRSRCGAIEHLRTLHQSAGPGDRTGLLLRGLATTRTQPTDRPDNTHYRRPTTRPGSAAVSAPNHARLPAKCVMWPPDNDTLQAARKQPRGVWRPNDGHGGMASSDVQRWPTGRPTIIAFSVSASNVPAVSGSV